MSETRLHTHEEALDAIRGCAATVTVLSYQEAIGAYFKLRGWPAPETVRAWPDPLHDLLALAADFIEEEADNRSAAGSECSDYEREPRELAARLRSAMEPLPPTWAPAHTAPCDDKPVILRSATWEGWCAREWASEARRDSDLRDWIDPPTHWMRPALPLVPE